MNASTTAARYTAYINSAFGYEEVGSSANRAAAWQMARSAAKKNGKESSFSVWPEIHDAKANAGRGGFTFPLNESY